MTSLRRIHTGVSFHRLNRIPNKIPKKANFGRRKGIRCLLDGAEGIEVVLKVLVLL